MPDSHVEKPVKQDARSVFTTHVTKPDVARSSEIGDRELQELRRILMGPEQDIDAKIERVAQLEEEGQVAAVSRVLPEAIALHREHDTRLVHALSPSIEKTLQVSVKRNPKPIVDAIFPIIGPAIRRSIAEALRSFMDAVNRSLEHSLSFKSLKWRVEAARTGRPFAEVMLLHTLDYRVEQIYVIDRKTGLPVQHRIAEDVLARDSDLVSGMFTAIQDLTRDMLGAPSDDTLKTVETHDLTVLLESGPTVVLAAVVRGLPSPELRSQLQQLIEDLHFEFGSQLETFTGDPAPFAALQPFLEAGMVAKYKSKQQKSRWFFWVLAALVLVAMAVWAASSIQQYVRWNGYVDQLKSEPGIIVTETSRQNGQWVVEGLRDPGARQPAAILTTTQLDTSLVRGMWKPFISLEPELVLARATTHLDPPASTSLRLDGQTLVAEGRATGEWMQASRTKALRIAGISAYVDSLLTPLADERLLREMQALESTTVRFAQARNTLNAAQDDLLDQIASSLDALGVLAASAGKTITIRVQGHVSTDGDANRNQRLSQLRAEAVRDRLVEMGYPATMFDVVATGLPYRVGPEQSDDDRAANRSVSFSVIAR